MRLISILKATPLLGVLSLALTAPAQVDPNRVVATVNGDEIKGSEYYRRMEFLPGVGKQDGATFFQAPPGFLTLEQLITERLVLQLAKQKSVYPSDLQIQAELKTRQEDNPNYLKEWTSEGRNADELNGQIRYELAQFNLETYGITVTDSEVADFYTKNPSTYTVPKQYKLRVIVVQSEADEAKVDKELATNKPFADVAKQYSVDISHVNGGDVGAVMLNMLSEPARDALSSVKIGQTTDWIGSKTAAGDQRYVKFNLVDIVPENKLALDDKLKRNIRKQLMLDRGHVKNDIRKEMDDMRTKAKIDISEPQFADIYKRFIDAYLKQHG